jgi:hypothetical protein
VPLLDGFSDRFRWYRVLNRDSVQPRVLEVAQNVMNFVATDLGLLRPIEIKWFAQDPQVASKQPFPDEHSVMHTFGDRLLREGVALGLDRIGGFTPEASTTVMMIRADVFDPDDTSQDRLRVSIAHEMRHIWQNLNWDGDRRRDLSLCEADARSYQISAINRYIAAYSAPE